MGTLDLFDDINVELPLTNTASNDPVMGASPGAGAGRPVHGRSLH